MINFRFLIVKNNGFEKVHIIKLNNMQYIFDTYKLISRFPGGPLMRRYTINIILYRTYYNTEYVYYNIPIVRLP